MPKAAKVTHPPRRPLNCESNPPLKTLLPPPCYEAGGGLICQLRPGVWGSKESSDSNEQSSVSFDLSRRRGAGRSPRCANPTCC
eukprot:6491047-Prymnesium_polylepis.1